MTCFRDQQHSLWAYFVEKCFFGKQQKIWKLLPFWTEFGGQLTTVFFVSPVPYITDMQDLKPNWVWYEVHNGVNLAPRVRSAQF